MKKSLIPLAVAMFTATVAMTTTAQDYTNEDTSKKQCPEDAMIRGLYHEDAPTMQMVINHCHIPNELLNRQCRGGICNPLVVATMQNRLDTVKVLVEAGADININSGASSGDTPLIFAIMNGNHEMTAYLVSQGADVNLKNNFGASPWWGAVASEDKANIQLFLDNGADVNATGSFPDMLEPRKTMVQGITPLRIASKNNDIELVKQLIGKQADVNLADSLGRTAVDYANTDEMKRLLMK